MRDVEPTPLSPDGPFSPNRPLGAKTQVGEGREFLHGVGDDPVPPVALAVSGPDPDVMQMPVVGEADGVLLPNPAQVRGDVFSALQGHEVGHGFRHRTR